MQRVQYWSQLLNISPRHSLTLEKHQDMRGCLETMMGPNGMFHNFCDDNDRASQSRSDGRTPLHTMVKKTPRSSRRHRPVQGRAAERT